MCLFNVYSVAYISNTNYPILLQNMTHVYLLDLKVMLLHNAKSDHYKSSCELMYACDLRRILS